MEVHGGKSKKKLGLSLKSSKKHALEFSKADAKKAVRKLDSRNARSPTFDEYFVKQKQDKTEKCLAGGPHVNSTTEPTEGFQGKHGLSTSNTR